MIGKPAGSVSVLCFIGFGEAAGTFVRSFGAARPADIRSYDIKTDDPSPVVRERKWHDYDEARIVGCRTAGDALAGAPVVFSTVTADQALAAARSASAHVEPQALYLDCNSCAPDTKRQAAALIDAAGGRYVDVAVMAPVSPLPGKTPLLISGPAALDARIVLGELGMAATVVAGEVGQASAVKMIRSVMVKGLEALVLECVLSGRKAGVDELVLDSLESSFPGFGWRRRAAYMLERVATHGLRRAAEMREVAKTVGELGLDGAMARATAEWQQRVGDLGLGRLNETDYAALADVILERLAGDADGPRQALPERTDQELQT